MATKSKYKKPENKKPTYRKDIKDYTMDDKKGGLNPKTTGDAHLTTFRKTDKELQDDGKMYPTYKDDDRLYKDLEDGDYDPKTAAKRLAKRQETEENDVADSVKDKINKLTNEQKDRLVREYIRKKIAKVLKEQSEPEQPEDAAAPADAPVDAPAPDAAPTDAPAPDAAPTDAPPAPDAAAATPPPPPPSAPQPNADASTAPAPAAPGANSEIEQLPPEEKNAIAIDKFVKHLQKETGNISRTKSIGKVLDSAMKDAEPADAKNFYKLILKMVANKYKNVIDKPEQSEK
jgi:outer membrane biosynthesis protein TonB